MKKQVIAALIASSGIASAQSINSHVQNEGRIQSGVSTYAAVKNNGTSLSVARNESSASASSIVSMLSAGGGAIGILGGSSLASSSGLAYNVSTGSGLGSAVSRGSVDSQAFGKTSFYAPGQNLYMSGDTDSGMNDAVRNGADMSVIANTDADGWASASTTGGFLIGGYVGSRQIAGGSALSGGVSDSKESASEAAAGRISFSGGTPSGQSSAERWANAGSSVNASGSFANSK